MDEPQLKDLVKVKMPNGSQRTSEQMTLSIVTLLLSVIATIVARNYDFELSETEIATLAAGLTGIAGSLSGLILRWRSRGGEVVLKKEMQKHR